VLDVRVEGAVCFCKPQAVLKLPHRPSLVCVCERNFARVSVSACCRVRVLSVGVEGAVCFL